MCRLRWCLFCADALWFEAHPAETPKQPQSHERAAERALIYNMPDDERF
jgi:hypothetical protein